VGGGGTRGEGGLAGWPCPSWTTPEWGTGSSDWETRLTLSVGAELRRKNAEMRVRRWGSKEKRREGGRDCYGPFAGPARGGAA